MITDWVNAFSPLCAGVEGIWDGDEVFGGGHDGELTEEWELTELTTDLKDDAGRGLADGEHGEGGEEEWKHGTDEETGEHEWVGKGKECSIVPL